MNFAIVKTHADLLRYATHLQARNSDAVGFLPRVVFERAAEAGQVFLGLLNGEPCGYILAGTGFQGVMRCRQVCIQYDVRRRLGLKNGATDSENRVFANRQTGVGLSLLR